VGGRVGEHGHVPAAVVALVLLLVAIHAEAPDRDRTGDLVLAVRAFPGAALVPVPFGARVRRGAAGAHAEDATGGERHEDLGWRFMVAAYASGPARRKAPGPAQQRREPRAPSPPRSASGQMDRVLDGRGAERAIRRVRREEVGPVLAREAGRAAPRNEAHAGDRVAQDAAPARRVTPETRERGGAAE